jgi:hypothetical protein
VRVWIGGELIVDAWDFPCCEQGLAVRLPLESGRRYALQVEYFAANRRNELALYWRTSSTSWWSAIPPCALFERTAAPSACPASFGDCVPAGTPACTVQDVNGVRATYYATPDLTGPGQSVIETFLGTGWLATSAPVGSRSVRWESDLVAPTRERYTLSLAARAPARLALEERLLLETGKAPPLEEVEAAADLVPLRHHRLVIEQRIDETSRFGLRLRWRSAQVPRATIPKCRFFLPPAPLPQDGGPSGGDGGP